jgi:uncharacterized protein YdeI (YjbR/CyaY-like superfamily)
MQSNADIKPRLVKQYVKDAIGVVQRGEILKPKRKSSGVALPPELAHALEGDAQLQRRFEAMTPGKRREYCEYIQQAKRADTKARRLEKSIPLILAGFGLNDQYR